MVRFEDIEYSFAAIAAGQLLVFATSRFCRRSQPNEHKEQSIAARNLAAARIVLCIIMLNHPVRMHGSQDRPGKFPFLTGLPLWTQLGRFSTQWVSLIQPWEPAAVKAALVAAMLGVCTGPAFVAAAFFELRIASVIFSHSPKIGHAQHVKFPLLLLFAIAPCSDALTLPLWLGQRFARCSWPTWVRRFAAQPRLLSAIQYQLPISCAALLMSTSYLTAGLLKLFNCNLNRGEMSASFFSTSLFRDLLTIEFANRCGFSLGCGLGTRAESCTVGIACLAAFLPAAAWAALLVGSWSGTLPFLLYQLRAGRS